jgi:hypothetical protein
MKRIISVLGILAVTACAAFGQTNWGKAVMYDSRTGRFLDPMVVTSNQLVVAGAQNSFTGTQTFYAVTLGGVTRINWPSGGAGGAWGTITGTLSDQTDLWAQLTNRYTKAEINGFGYLTAIPSYYTTNGMSGVNFGSLTIGGNSVLTNYNEIDPVWNSVSNQFATTNWVTGLSQGSCVCE